MMAFEPIEVDNAALTGESVPEARQVMPDGLTSPMLEARSMMFLGTTMVRKGFHRGERLGKPSAACAKRGSNGQMQTPAELVPIPDASRILPDASRIRIG